MKVFTIQSQHIIHNHERKAFCGLLMPPDAKTSLTLDLNKKSCETCLRIHLRMFDDNKYNEEVD